VERLCKFQFVEDLQGAGFAAPAIQIMQTTSHTVIRSTMDRCRGSLLRRRAIYQSPLQWDRIPMGSRPKAALFLFEILLSCLLTSPSYGAILLRFQDRKEAAARQPPSDRYY
jgi:hypothetical protein